HDLLLDLAEARLAVGGEDLRDRQSPAYLYQLVGVAELHVESSRELPADSRLAGPGRAHQHRGRAGRSAHAGSESQSRRSATAPREPATFRRVSPSESPPNFCRTARARTSATMDSATTPAAGTAHTSERWWMAVASLPSDMSTVLRARGTVEIGFIAARTRSGWPLLMPPSSPPARLLRRSTPSAPRMISSCATLPRRRAVSNPSPTSTPLMA